MRNPKYWNDLIAEGRTLTHVAEGEARNLVIPQHSEDRAGVRRLADAYRASVDDTRPRDPERPEHQLQDVIDAYRWMYPHTDRRVGTQGMMK